MGSCSLKCSESNEQGIKVVIVTQPTPALEIEPKTESKIVPKIEK